MKRCLAKGYFQGDNKGSEASARTQVYLSETKLENTGGGLAIYIVTWGKRASAWHTRVLQLILT